MGEPFLEYAERARLVELVAGLYDFTDQGVRGRRVFLQETAGLGRFVPGIDLAGTPRLVAGDLVGKLERFGDLPERPAYHALGALLTALLDLSDLTSQEKTFAAELIVRYSLVGDPTYLSDLRSRFGIRAAVVRSAPMEAPPRGVLEAPAAPRFVPRVDDETGLESIINSADNFLDLNLLMGAVYSAQAVGRIERPEGKASGTGFLVGPDLLLTNQHVLKDASVLSDAIVRFGYVADASGISPKGKVVALQTGFYWASPAEELDYALVRLATPPLQDIEAKDTQAQAPIEELMRIGLHRGYLPLLPRVLEERSRVNIIQHPDGDPLKVVLTQNYVVRWTDTRLQYVADTMEGSSGSPVFNHRWEVVALHHSGTAYPPESVGVTVKKAWKGHFRVNEGIPIRAVLEDFKKRGIDRHLPRQ